MSLPERLREAYFALTYEGERLGSVLPECKLCCQPYGKPHEERCDSIAIRRAIRMARIASGLRESLASWPEGLDEYGAWTAWSEIAKPQVQALVALLYEDESKRRS